MVNNVKLSEEEKIILAPFQTQGLPHHISPQKSF